MTSKQASDYRQMQRALRRIKLYMKPERLEQCAEKRYGCTYLEALEGAYENVLEEARQGLVGVRNLPDVKEGR